MSQPRELAVSGRRNYEVASMSPRTVLSLRRTVHSKILDPITIKVASG